MSLRRYFSVLAGSAALCLGATILAPSPAMAAPTDCTRGCPALRLQQVHGRHGRAQRRDLRVQPVRRWTGPRHRQLGAGRRNLVGADHRLGVERIWVNKRG